MIKETTNIVGVVLCVAAALVGCHAGSLVAYAAFVVGAMIFYTRARYDAECKRRAKIEEIHNNNQALKNRIVELHMRLNAIATSEESSDQIAAVTARSVVELLVEAASNLGDAPSTLRGVDRESIPAGTRGIALIRHAEARMAG